MFQTPKLHTTSSIVSKSYTKSETEQQPMQWHHSTSPTPKQLKQSPYSNRKMMATVFLDERDWLILQNIGQQLQLTRIAKRSPNSDVRSTIEEAGSCRPKQSSMKTRILAPLPEPRRTFNSLLGNFFSSTPQSRSCTQRLLSLFTLETTV